MQVQLDLMRPSETEVVRALLNDIVQAGDTYPQASPLTSEEFASYWLKGDAFVVRLCQELQGSGPRAAAIAGAFYLKPNFPGRCSHIGNAGFIVAPRMRGQGIGRLMGEAMLALACDRGYRGIMYNLIFETNQPSLRLWETLGFETLGRIPGAVRLSGDRYVDAIMLYKSLVTEN